MGGHKLGGMKSGVTSLEKYVMYGDKTRAMSFTRQCRHISQVRWTTKLSCDVKLCQEFWCQKLLKSDNYSSTYSQQYEWVFFSETRCTCMQPILQAIAVGDLILSNNEDSLTFTQCCGTVCFEVAPSTAYGLLKSYFTVNPSTSDDADYWTMQSNVR